MSNELSRLIDLLPPPAQPISSIGDWSAAETALGTSLPNDYKQFIQIYGTGSIDPIYSDLWNW